MQLYNARRNSCQAIRQLSAGTPESPAPADLRPLFAGQARLLAERSERGLPIDVRSLWNLACVFRAIAEAEIDGEVV